MEIFEGLPPAAGRSIVAIGNFDGVHLGHRAILAEVCRRAREAGAKSVVVTFDPHPLRVLRPSEAPPLLTPIPERLRLLGTTGVNQVVVLPFTDLFSRESARGFTERVLRDGLGATAVHEGDNFRFGYRAQAGLPELRALGAELGFSVTAHPMLHRRGLPVSSSTIRALVAKGEVERARALLGRPFAIVSTQARGRGIGSRLLVPTVNLAPYAELKPEHGVYVTCVQIGDRRFQGITNAGNRPTFGADSYAIESHLLDFEPMELDENTPVRVEFLHRLRGEQRFPSPEALKVQIGLDVARARRYHRRAARLVS